MTTLLRALFTLLAIQALQATGRFGQLQAIVSRKRTKALDGPRQPERVLGAFRTAVALYPKRILCLQRSAALVILLRENGFPANLVIGVSSVPFRAHAWVELRDSVLDESVEVRQRYVVVDRW